MYIKTISRSNRAFTLNEMMVSVGVFSIGTLVLASIFIFCLRSFSALANYAILDVENRETMDRLTREIRQAHQVSNYSSSPPTLTIINGINQTVIYGFDPAHQRMTRTVSGIQQVLLENCSLINFNLYQRNPTNASYNLPYTVASSNWGTTVKVVELTWKTSRSIGGLARVNSENVQTARIVIRKQ